MSDITGKMNLIGLSYNEILQYLQSHYSKGKYHAKLLYQSVYQKRSLGIGSLEQELMEDCSVDLPPIGSVIEEGDTIKYLLTLDDGLESESIILPMNRYNTLCVSSQVGCRWSCAFCETGKLGLKRSLTTAEILFQLMTARFIFKKEIRNIVFMGMGEPLDNFENVIKAIDIITHPWGMGINNKSICISTVGNVDGINRLSELACESGNDYHKLHLAVSLNGADDLVRSELMPVNRKWPMSSLKEALLGTPQFGKKDLLFIEYVLIVGKTDGPENGKKLIEYVKGFPRITVNLIPFNPGENSTFSKPDSDEINRFHRQILDAGIRCFTRNSQGEDIMAACGQLGNKENKI